MKSHRKVSIMLLAAGLGLALAACGDAGSSGTEQPGDTTANGAGCAPVAGEELVVLDDDKKLQNSDNIVAVFSGKTAPADAVAATDKVAAALDTNKLIALNKAADVDRKSVTQVATEFATTANITNGITKGAGGALKIGAANFSESQILAELYKIALVAAGYDATVQTVGNREIYEPALERGEIQVFPEYAATLTEFLNQKANGKDAPAKASGDINATMTELKTLGAQYNLAFGTPSAATDQNAFAVTKAFADQHGLKTLSDFAAKCSGTASILAGPPECPDRPFCQPGLKDKYDITFGEFRQADAGGPQTKTALKTGTASLGLVFSSDGSLVPLK
jgi:osmoprotectant transport system substrate-binding protein